MLKILFVDRSPSAQALPALFPETMVIRETEPLKGVTRFIEENPNVVLIRGDCSESIIQALLVFRENRLPEARFVVLADMDPKPLEELKKKAAVYGARQVTHADTPAGQIADMIETLTGCVAN